MKTRTKAENNTQNDIKDRINQWQNQYQNNKWIKKKLYNPIQILVMIKIISIILTVGSFFTSCTGNNIYFDVQDQAIVSCNEKGIIRLYINNDSIAEVYSLFWTDSLNDAPSLVKLNELDKGYEIAKGWNNAKINADDFKLSPFSNYTIERSQGDATPYEILVKTGGGGEVVYANPEECR